MNQLLKGAPYAALLSIFSFITTTQAGSEPLTFAEAIAHAVSESPDVGARAAALDSAQALVTPAGQLPDPELVLGVDNLPATGPDSGSLTNDFMTMRKVGVMQAFPSRTKRSARTQRAEDAVQVARAEEMLTQLDVKRETAQAWIAAYTAEKTLAALRALEPDFALQARLANAQVGSARLSAGEALDAQRALILFQDRLQIAVQNSRRARAMLARWLPQDADRELADAPDFTRLPGAQALTDVRRHAMLAAYEAQLKAARSEVALAQAEKHPDWSAGLTYGKRGPSFADMVSVEVRVGLPLFSGSRQNPTIAARRAELRRLEAEQESQWRMHGAEVAQAIADWDALKTRALRYQDELLPLAKQRIQLALASLQSGKAGVRPVLEARASEVEIQVQALELEDELGRSWASLNYLQEEGVSP